MKKTLSILFSFAMVVSSINVQPVHVIADDTINVSTNAELKAALDRNTPVQAINIIDSFTVNDDCTIQLDPAHIDYYSDTVITIEEGVTLTIGDGGRIGSFWPSYEGDPNTPPNSSVINNGQIIIEKGGATEADFDKNNGSILVKDGGKAVCCNTNNGDVVVENGGAYITTQGSTAVNFGRIVIEKGAVMQSRFGTSIINETGGEISLEGQFYCGCIGLKNADVCWFENRGTVSGNGDLIIYEASHEELPVADMDGLILDVMSLLGQEKRFENWEDINIYKKIEASDFNQIKAATTGLRKVAGEEVEGDMDTLIELTDNIEVQFGETIETMAQITIPEGTTLTLNTGADVSCGIENYGTVDVKTGAFLSTTMGGSIVNHNKIFVADKSILRSQMGGQIINCDGADMVMNGILCCGYIFHDGIEEVCFDNNGRICGDGKFYFYGAENGQEIEPSELPGPTQKVLNQIGKNAEVASMFIQLSHIADEGTVIEEPSYDKEGIKAHKCVVCGAAMENETIPKLTKTEETTKIEEIAKPSETTNTAVTTKAEETTKPAEVVIKVQRKDNTLSVKGKKPSLKYNNLKKKKQTIKLKNAITIKAAKGTVTYKVVKAVRGKKNYKKYFKIAKNGNITVKKGLKKGTYKVTVDVTATGDKDYSAATKTAVISIKVK
jgi:hypothetical protein